MVRPCIQQVGLKMIQAVAYHEAARGAPLLERRLHQSRGANDEVEILGAVGEKEGRPVVRGVIDRTGAGRLIGRASSRMDAESSRKSPRALRGCSGFGRILSTGIMRPMAAPLKLVSDST